MLTLTIVLIVIACVFLTLIILIQNPKGGGIAANFMAPSQIMGVKRSSDVVEKGTWVLAIIIISLSLLSNFFRPTTTEEVSTDSRLKENIENVAVPTPPQQQTPMQEGSQQQEQQQDNQPK